MATPTRHRKLKARRETECLDLPIVHSFFAVGLQDVAANTA